MNWSGLSVFVGLVAIALSTMPWGGILLVGAIAWLWRWEQRKKK